MRTHMLCIASLAMGAANQLQVSLTIIPIRTSWPYHTGLRLGMTSCHSRCMWHSSRHECSNLLLRLIQVDVGIFPVTGHTAILVGLFRPSVPIVLTVNPHLKFCARLTSSVMLECF